MKNLVEEWKKQINWLSSDFNPSRRYRIKKSVFINVEKVLFDFWGKEYFEINESQKYPDIYNDVQNWLHLLLSNFDFNTMRQLFELVNVIEFYHRTNPEILNSLISKSKLKNLQRFKDEYFELYTFAVLDMNEVKNRKKVYEGEGELEGDCILQNTLCLFECKRLQNPLNKTRDTLLYFITEAGRLSKKHRYPLLMTISLEKDDKNIKSIFSKLLNDYMIKSNNCKTLDDYETFNLTTEKGTRLVFDYYTPEKYELLKHEANSDLRLLFKVVQSISSKEIHFHCQPEININYSDKKMSDYVLKQINKKRKDRANSKYSHRIYFFENELCGLDLPLTTSPNGLTMGMKNKISEYLNRKNTNDVVVIISKDLITQKKDNIKVDIFCKENLKSFAEEINKWNFQIS